jgi:hypothetical protein
MHAFNRELLVAAVQGLEHHLWIIEGSLNIDVEGSRFQLHVG